MAKFTVTEITEIRTTYVIDEKSAPSAIRKVKKHEYQSSPVQTIEQHFTAREIKEEINNG